MIQTNGTRRVYRQYPQHHHHRRQPVRKSFAYVKDTMPATLTAPATGASGGGGSGVTGGGGGGDVNIIPSIVDGDDKATQHPRHTTLPITSHRIQMTQQHPLIAPPSPRLPARSSNKGAAIKSSSSSSSFSALKKSLYRLLIIDDSHLLVKALRVDGHHCDEVNNLSTAMVLLHDKLVHDNDNGNDNIMYNAVIIATTRNGPSICKSIRALSPDVIIFGVTNTVFFREETRIYKKCGATSVLVKPFDMAFFMDFLCQMAKLEEEEEEEEDNQSNEMMV
jgi:hypothetical protein